MSQLIEGQLDEIIEAFGFEGNLRHKGNYGSGHINDTLLLVFDGEDATSKKVVLQRINTDIFRNPDELMENIIGITAYLRERIIENGGDPERETLNVLFTKNQEPYFKDSLGQCWRAYDFVTETMSYDTIERPEDFYESGLAFGHFQKLLADYPAEKLHETIQNFHNTRTRFDTFAEAVRADSAGRAAAVKDEIQFICDRESVSDVFVDLQAAGALPLRVTHNDTKLNNVLLDKTTGKGICVVDLDTVMPGLAMNDFGDAIRSGASTAAEDETDLSKVHCDMTLYTAFAKGFLEACGDSLTRKEIELLPMGAMMMTYESAVRFLTDYLQGDTYFKIDREHHNLDRCRTQIRLIEEMEAQWDEMQEIIAQLMI